MSNVICLQCRRGTPHLCTAGIGMPTYKLGSRIVRDLPMITDSVDAGEQRLLQDLHRARREAMRRARRLDRSNDPA